MNVDCLSNRIRGLSERGFREPSADSNSPRGKVTAAASVAKAGNSKEGIILIFGLQKAAVVKQKQKQDQERDKRGAF